MTEAYQITCPHCWESIAIVLDLSEPEQTYIEDCSVCCRPISIHVSAAGGEILDVEASASE
ncbi:MAG TPA: CPXCG motif-containing cysteine-rich protein [Steroidobacteraceae bacterium]|nr:CPXCG motif-containing cysteine-rich protein [Steroidobacteraceae bacterium]